MTDLQFFEYPHAFVLESGKTIENLKLAYQTFGTLQKDKSNVVWVFHAISGNTDVLDWWQGLFGANRLYDPEKYFIICVNAIGSPYGSTAPQDLSFPQFSMRDVVNAHFLGQIQS